jgi:hypothetical protein
MSSAIVMSPARKPPLQLALVSSQRPKFNAEFLERRMRAHRQWQEREAEDLTAEIFREVLDYTGRGLQKLARMR